MLTPVHKDALARIFTAVSIIVEKVKFHLKKKNTII
jgi:hypothetical protein